MIQVQNGQLNSAVGKTLGVLRHRPFLIFWVGACISNIGNPLRASAGIGYVLSEQVQVEFSYYAQFERSNGGPLEFTENIFRLNIKIHLNREHAAHGPTPSL